MSDPSSSDSRPDVGEAVIVGFCVVALLLAAGFLPTFNVFESGPGDTAGDVSGGEEQPTANGTPTAENVSGGEEQPTANGTPTAENVSGGEEQPTANGTPTAENVSGGEEQLTANGTPTAGSPLGGSLSMPDQAQVGDTSDEPVTDIPQTPLFVVRSPRDTYWRQGAYTTYTGTGWERPGEWQPIAEGVPGEERTANARALEYEVRLLQAGRSLPTAWQPESVRLDDIETEVQASTQGGIRSDGQVPSNTTYLARSSSPLDDRDRLNRAGQDYPDTIERRYGKAPEATDRVSAFTADLTANADTPYETAVVIRDWLQSNKPYSLNVSHEGGEPIADQFLFEMERGYCVYYATTMAVMLRTQEIPARYVVGFASGSKPVGGNEYLVTSDQGHAWVEVYFPDVGWVRFDPTGSGDMPIADPQPPYNISLNRSAVAGAPVSVGVEKNDSAVVGAPVYVNDERVGWSGSDGTVSTRLPYASNVTITARSPGTETKYTDGTRVVQASVGNSGGVPAVGGAPGGGSSRIYSLRMPSLAAQDAINGSSKTYESETDTVINVTGDLVVGESAVVNATIRGVPVRGATVTIDGDPVGETNASGLLVLSLDDVSPGDHRVTVTRDAVAGNGTFTVANATATPTPTPRSINVSVTGDLVVGESAVVNATIRGVPVRGATVTIDGDPVGETNASGLFVLSLDDVSPGDHRVTVTNDAVAGNGTFTVANATATPTPTPASTEPRSINVSVTTSTRLPLPGASATVKVTRAGESVPGASVRVADGPGGKTGEDGTLSISLPIADSITIAATGPEGTTATTTISGLYRNSVAVLGSALAILLTFGLVVRRSEALTISRLMTLMVNAVLWLAGSILQLRVKIRQRTRRIGAWLALLPDRLAGSSLAALRTLDPRRLIGALRRWLLGLFRRTKRGVGADTRDQPGMSGVAGEAEGEEETKATPTPWELWRKFVLIVRPPRASTRTPGEIARYAVDRGLPKKPVTVLTDLYRDAEYGGVQADDSRVRQAIQALNSIRETEENE